MPNKLIVDQISTPGGSSFSFPATDGTTGQYLKTDGAGNLGFITLTSPLAPTDNIAPVDGVQVFGSVVSSSARQNGTSPGPYWTTSGPNSTYQHEQAAGGNLTYTQQAWNMFLGDGYPNTGATGARTYSGDWIGHPQRQIQYGNNYRTGWNKMQFYYPNATSYSGCTWRVMPVRNTTASSITRTVNFLYSSYSTYTGASAGYFTPSSSGANTYYSQQNTGTWTQGFTTTGSVNTTAGSMSVVFPANTTILILLNTAHQYITTYQFPDTNMFTGLQTLLTTGLVCDLRMLQALQYCRSDNNVNTASYPHQIYNACAVSFGDR